MGECRPHHLTRVYNDVQVRALPYTQLTLHPCEHMHCARTRKYIYGRIHIYSNTNTERSNRPEEFACELEHANSIAV